MSAEQPPKPKSQAPERASGEHARVSGSHSRFEGERPEGPEELDLTAAQRERIDDTFRQLKTSSLYDLLGVARAADKKEIKRAYFERTNEFHPDRFFRKRLGGFKPKMEAIFGRITEAHDILCSPDRRAAYDAALRTNRFSMIEDMLAEAASEMEGAEEGSKLEEAMFDDAIRVAPPPPPPVEPRVASRAQLPPDAQARREALARRLTGQRPRSTTPPARPPTKN